MKSTFAATEVVLLVMRVPNIHAVVLRKVGNTIATSVWPEYNRVIDRMGIRHLWKQTKKPYTLTYVPTGQTIQFYGLDDPGKLKSIAVPFGYFGVMHFEEFDQYDGPEEIRNVEQSVFRGGPFSFSFKTFNSPAMARHWVNRYKREAKPKQFRHHTTYLTTPPEWLGPRFYDDAETLKQRDPVAYAHEYLGESVEGKTVFIADDIIASGESMLEVASNLKERGAARIIANATFPLFTSGLAKFDQAVAEGKLTYVVGTNLTYRKPELLTRDWYVDVDVSKYAAYFVVALNHDMSVSSIIDPLKKIENLLANRK